MKIPLIATVNHRTIDLRDSSQRIKIYRNGNVEAIKSPLIPYYYTVDKDGKEYKTIASDKKVKLKKHTHQMRFMMVDVKPFLSVSLSRILTSLVTSLIRMT